MFIKLLCFFIVCIQTFFYVQGHAHDMSIFPNGSLSGKKMYEFIAKASKVLEKKYKIFLIGIGGGVKDKICLMNLSFNKYGLPLREMEIRKLLIFITQDFLDIVNKDHKLRPYLHDYPFTFKNVTICLFSYTEGHGDYYHPYMTSVSVHEGRVMFLSYDPGNRRPLRVHDKIHETYEESLAILAKEKQGQ